MLSRALRSAVPAILVGLSVAACSEQSPTDTTPSGTRSPVATAPTIVPSPTVASTTPPSAPSPTATMSTATVPATATPGAPAIVVRSVDAPSVVLTFDAGADAGYTESILDTLATEGIRASFGITGEWANENPALLRRIADEGHSFINHSYDHGSFTGLSDGRAPLTREERWAQLDTTEAAIHGLTGETSMPYFRPPYGDYDDSVNAHIGARGYRYNVMWTVDSYGWRALTAPEIAARCLELSEPGAIYIFHVGSASQDGLALPAIIAGLRAQGYEFAHLPDVLP